MMNKEVHLFDHISLRVGTPILMNFPNYVTELNEIYIFYYLPILERSFFIKYLNLDLKST